MLLGSWERLREPDSVVLDKGGYVLLFPGGRSARSNARDERPFGDDRRHLGCLAAFRELPVMHTRYSEAVTFVGRSERNFLPHRAGRAGSDPKELHARIQLNGLRARTTNDFHWDCVRYYLKNTGIPVKFRITIAVHSSQRRRGQLSISSPWTT